MFGLYFIFVIILIAIILKGLLIDKNKNIGININSNSRLGKVIYGSPVASAVILNIVSLLIVMYSIKNSISSFYFALIFVGLWNRKILDNGINLTKKKRLIILLSFFTMLGVFLIYNTYIHNIKINEIIKNSH